MADPVRHDDEERQKRRRRRSIALGLALGALVLIFYALTIAKMGPAILDRPL
ncbi:MAG TPA: hypothetical protein VGN80_11555 [Devosiaceae bacterium]|jgi:hypothetical protein|nr:hypothetical protein [Devosiaceae bacterium]